MSRLLLEPRALLDPRDEETARRSPIADAVNIPFNELSARMHELPPRHKPVVIAAIDRAAAEKTRDFLIRQGRRVEVLPTGMAFAPGTTNSIGRLWEPTPLLSQFAPGLKSGTALELACGTGRDAIYLASLGWNVTAVDILPDAIERGRALETRCSASVEPIDWRAMDVESNPDAIQGRFDLISIFRFLHRPFFSHLSRLLSAGGVLVSETFTTEHRARFGKPARDSHVLEMGELRRLLSEFEILHDSEADREWGHTAQIVARRPVATRICDSIPGN